MPFGVHDHAFYKPKWRRVAIVALAAAWAMFELLLGKDGLWTVISIAVWAYCFWAFLLNWKDQA
jgi:hypothetical protein